MKPPYILAIDQGTTSSRAILFDSDAQPVASRAIEIRQIYPDNGWVEHDAAEIWQTTLTCCREVLKSIAAKDVAAIGITNQRETTVVWDRRTGEPLYNAIVWQDRRTSDRCRALKAQGQEEKVSARTGLLLDPYFSATKLEWLLDHIPGSREKGARGEIAFGTVDAWLIYQLTGGKVHATDVTNASRTMLFNLKSLAWDDDMLALFNVPRGLLPEVRDSSGDFGTTDLFGAPIRVLGVAGDQQAALFGQTCFNPGDVKSTYGTGCFALVNTGAVATPSRNRLISTAGYRAKGQTAYAIEGSIFIAGAVVQWLRDAVGVIRTAAEIEAVL